MSTRRRAPLDKSAAMFTCMLSLWAGTAIWFDPRLVALIAGAQSVPEGITLTLFVICLNVFWLFAASQVVTWIFSLRGGDDPPEAAQPTPKPAVAVLYLTMDDFCATAAMSCVGACPRNGHVFLCDDSTSAECAREIDEFHARFPGVTTIVRRKDRAGFKAGNINNVLRREAGGYPFFAIVDADGVLPSDFIDRLMPYFALDPSIAFVQGGLRPRSDQQSRFAADLAPSMLPLWMTHYRPRNKFGFVPFLGRGAVLRRDAWAQIGGFPETLAEDLAYSTALAEQGYRGVHCPRTQSCERFPTDLVRLRSQHARYVRGAHEYVRSGRLALLLKSPRPSWFEKLDVVMWVASLFLPIVCLAFVVLYVVVMPLVLAEPARTPVVAFGQNLGTLPTWQLSDRLGSLWSTDFYVLTIVCLLAPIIGSLRGFPRGMVGAVRCIALSVVPFVSLSFVSAVALARSLRGDACVWDVTGARSQRGLRSPSHRASGRLAVEALSGIVLGLACLATANAGLLVFPLALVLGPIACRIRWENRALATVLPLPGFALALILALGGADIWGLQGVAYGLTPLHL